MKNRITELFQIQYPIIQAGMVWCSGWELASAVSNAGGLGLIGSGSMDPDVLRVHIRKCREATDKSFGVNVPLIYTHVEEQMKVVIEEGVRIVFTSAGNPKTWTGILKKEGIKTAHVASSLRFAQKSVEAGVDAVVAEGFEAGGHNGREETTTLCLVQDIAGKISKPLIAAGGIATGRSMLAMMALGAEGVQIGSRFVASVESSAHQGFKERIVGLPEGSTKLVLKKLTPVRLIMNDLYLKIRDAEDQGAEPGALLQILGKGRARRGMFEGDLDEGELEIGQVASLIRDIKPAASIVEEIWNDYLLTKAKLCDLHQTS